MAFLEIAMAVLSFDIGFLIDLIMNNLFWVFGFIAAGYFFSDKKSLVVFGTVYALMMLFTVDIFSIVGFGIYTGTGLFFLYITRLSALLFLQDTKTGAPLIPTVYTMIFFVVFAVAALGLI